MYEPELSITGLGDTVLVIDSDSAKGFIVGRYTGNSRPESESYEISIIDPHTDETARTSFYHKEDLYENTKENENILRRR